MNTKEETDDTMLYLNFDMIGSPNYIRAIYDGDGSGADEAPVGPPASGEIEAIFNGFFEMEGLAHEPTPFNGRSDYGPFIANTVPAGGLFTGAEASKSERQAELYGGTAGEPLDACYHQECDDIDNVNLEVFEQMSNAVLHATYIAAMDEHVPFISGRFGSQGLMLEPEVKTWNAFLPWLNNPED